MSGEILWAAGCINDLQIREACPKLGCEGQAIGTEPKIKIGDQDVDV